jgi:hypothetical protein
MTPLMRKRLSEVPASRPRVRLSIVEQAMLFDTAMDADENGADLSSSRLLAAFAAAYLAIRDRADGIV